MPALKLVKKFRTDNKLITNSLLPLMPSTNYIDSAKRTIETELQGIAQLLVNLDDQFSDACNLLLGCKGRIIVSGIGKSGHIGKKMAATFASTGSPAFFVHPAEASHGDLGMISHDDVVITISNSGNSAEIMVMIPVLKRIGCKIIAITGNPQSSMAELADCHLNIMVPKEACPLGLAPTTSTTATLVMGDALAVSLLEARGFTAEDFAVSHPSGALGRKLLLKVADLMHSDEQLPAVSANTSLKLALLEMSSKSLGMTTVLDGDNHLVGVFTDGDLRRIIDKPNFDNLTVGDVMSTQPKTISPNALAVDAVNIMQDNQILALVVNNDDDQVVGIIHMHDLLRAGIL